MLVACALLCMSTCVASLKKRRNADDWYALPGDPQWPTTQHIGALRRAVQGRVLSGDPPPPDRPKQFNYGTYGTGAYRHCVVVEVSGAADVAAALTFARRHNLRVAIFSTGHDYKSRSVAENGLLLDMSRLQTVSVNEREGWVAVSSGVTGKDMLRELYRQTSGRWTSITGYYPGVAMCGFAGGGGISPLHRVYGMGADAIMGAELVTANGTLVSVMEGDESGHRELLRALRGGGIGSFGVVMRLFLRLYRESSVEAFVLDNIRGIAPGLIGTAEIEAFSADMPDNVSFYMRQTMDGNGVSSTLFYAGCHSFGRIQLCRSRLARLGLAGFYRTYSSHYAYVMGILGAEMFPSNKVAYISSIAIPREKIRTGSLSYMERFLYTLPRSPQLDNVSCTLRPTGGRASLLDPNGEDTTISMEFRQSELFGTHIITCDHDDDVRISLFTHTHTHMPTPFFRCTVRRLPRFHARMSNVMQYVHVFCASFVYESCSRVSRNVDRRAAERYRKRRT